MAETELKIRHVSYPINGKSDAFWYNFLEGFGRASGWAVIIGLAVFAPNYFGDDEAASSPTETLDE